MKSRTYKRRQKQRKQTRRQKQSGGFLLQTDGFTYFIRRLGLPADSNHRAIYTHPNFSRELHDYIIANSSIELLTDHSLYGYIYKATLKPHSPIYFKMFKFDGTRIRYSDITQFIIKIATIAPREYKYYNNTGLDKSTCTKDAFDNECIVQNEVYINGTKAGMPITPPLLSPYPIYIENTQHQPIYDLLNAKNKSQLRSAASVRGVTHVGYIIMGFANNFRDFDVYLKNPKITIDLKLHAKMIARVYALVLASMGYKHEDLHAGNFMYNPNAYNVFYNNTTKRYIDGSMYILDFGRVARFDEETRASIELALSVFPMSVEALNTVYGTLTEFKQDWMLESDYANRNIFLNSLSKYIAAFYNGIIHRMHIFKITGYNISHSPNFLNVANMFSHSNVEAITRIEARVAEEAEAAAARRAAEEAEASVRRAAEEAEASAARRAAEEAEAAAARRAAEEAEAEASVRRAAEEAEAAAARRAAEEAEAEASVRRAAAELALRPILNELTDGMHYDVYSHENALIANNVIYTGNDAENLYFSVNNNIFNIPFAEFNTAYFFTFANSINNADEFVLGRYYDVYQYPENKVPQFIAKCRFINVSPPNLAFFTRNTSRPDNKAMTERIYIPIVDINTNFIFVRSTA